MNRRSWPGWGATLLIVLLALPSCSHDSSASAERRTLATYAGSGVAGSGGDGGDALVMQLGTPSGLAFDRKGNLYIADQSEHRVRRIGRSGRVETFAGTGVAGYGGDGGPAVAAQLDGPVGLAVDHDGGVLIADQRTNRVRRVDESGVITTVAGDGRQGFRGDGGPAVDAVLNGPSGVAVDSTGNVFIADTNNRRVRRVDTSGTIATVAGGEDVGDDSEMDLGSPAGVAVEKAGTLAIAVPERNRVVRLGLDTRLSVVAGDNGSIVDDSDGLASLALLSGPTGLASDDRGNLFVTEAAIGRVRRIDSEGKIFTVASSGEAPAQTTPPRPTDLVTQASLDSPGAVAVDPSGPLFVADAGGHRVRRLDRTSAKGFTVSRQPTVDSLSPASGGAMGETAVVVRGHGFSRARTIVKFGSVPGRVVSVVTGEADDELLVMSPPQAAGQEVDVTVTTQSGTSPKSPGSRFGYAVGWERAAPLAVERFGHTATLLDPPDCRSSSPPSGYPCGSVLVSSGIRPPYDRPPSSDPGALGLVSRAELYDPATNVWRDAGESSARTGATATLMDDGRVLVVGGAETELWKGLATAEIYDPAVNGWAPAADMAGGRLGHTATLLTGPDCAVPERPRWCGKVLVAGGAAALAPTASAELYDPETDTWTAASPMSASRTRHAATVLADGRILVAAGAGPVVGAAGTIQALTSTEIYTPATDRWEPTGSLAVGRFDLTATRLSSGEVLATGGNVAAEPYVFSQSAEVYDVTKGTWRPTGLPLTARAAHTATLLTDGRVLVAGGGPAEVNPVSARPDSIGSAELYDPASNQFTATRSLNTARTLSSAVLLQGPVCRGDAPAPYCGAVLSIGGGGTSINPDSFSSPTPLATSEIYRPS